MGQSATLYRISKDDFPKIIENYHDFGLQKIKKGYATFDKTYEGLQFILTKKRHRETVELMEQIFFPRMFVGEQIDYENFDFNFLEQGKEPIHYHEPKVVKMIASILNEITIEEFKNNFDSDELNKENIYPSDVWNESTEEDYDFNERYMVEEFIKLQTFFNNAMLHDDYILSYVG